MFTKNSLSLLLVLLWAAQGHAVKVVPLTESVVSPLELDGRELYSYCECSDGLPTELGYVVNVSERLEVRSDSGFLKALFEGSSCSALFLHENPLESFCVQLTFGATGEGLEKILGGRSRWTDIRIYGRSVAVRDGVLACVKDFVGMVLAEPC